MFVRILSSAAAGLIVTMGLLFLMQYLVEVSEAAGTPHRKKIDLTWLAVIEDTPVVPRDIRPPRPTPPPDERRSRPPIDSGEEFIPVGPPPVVDTPSDTGWKLKALNQTDGGLMTIVAVQPSYPQIARDRGLEGQVIVRFDVSEMGTVTNVEIVESSSRMFNRAAINAAQKFRFKPKIVDGMPRMSYGVQRMFTFEMEK